jgi:hypothetical protein
MESAGEYSTTLEREVSARTGREMRRVLMISPHFPPDTSAATHRVRLLAPHLPHLGWEPTVLTVEPSAYHGRIDSDLEALVPRSLRVIRVPAAPVRAAGRLRLSDLGLRSFRGLYGAASRLLRDEHFDALFITIFPMYSALLGPLLKRRVRVPFVLDYIDPWVGAWGLTVGGGPNGAPDLKSRLSRWLGTKLEPVAVGAADAITAVSAATYEQILERDPDERGKLCAEIPYGGEVADFDHLRRHPRLNTYFDTRDGSYHVCYVGTLLPLGIETLRAVLAAVAVLKERRPLLYSRLRLHFFGTSNQTTPNAPARVLPIAKELGIADRVQEIPTRIDYLDALTVQTQASAVLMMGSTERHYTASKLYPGLLSRRPVLAVYHAESTVSAILQRAAHPPAAHLITYDEHVRAGERIGAIAEALTALMTSDGYDPRAVDLTAVQEYSAASLAGRLARVFDAVASAQLTAGSTGGAPW